ncbi:MAG: hypothetical protein ACREE6_12800, partial [Limisphaerales bacterium]
MNLERTIRISPAESRVITLAFLSRSLPAALLGKRIARALAAETDQPVALIRLARPTSGDTTTIRRNGAADLSGEFPLPAEIPNGEDGYYHLSVGENGELYQPEWIPSLVEQLRRRFRYVLIEAVADDVFGPSLVELLQKSNSGYLFVRAANEDVYHLDLLVRELRDR